jgi:hypothetical protein
LLALASISEALVYHPRMTTVATFCVLIAVCGNAFLAQQSTMDTNADAQRELLKWEEVAEARYNALIAKNGNGRDKALRAELLQMGDEDQRVRQPLMTLPQNQWNPDMQKAQVQEDEDLTARLKKIVLTSGWPTISMVGIKASEDAMLILIHTSDHAWQRAMIPQLERLVKNDEIVGSGLAVLIDKELVAAGAKQRFGSQFKFADGEMALYAVEDPADLDALRGKWLLPPEEVYKQMMSQIYSKLKMTNKVVSPEPPAHQKPTHEP